jgi:hypothetical protein
MFHNRLISAGLVIVSLVLAVPSANAQGAVPSEQNLDSRIRATAPIFALGQKPEEAMLSGNGDLVLLRRAKLFNFQASLTAATTDNAFLGSEELQQADYGVMSLGVGGQLALGDRTLVTLGIDSTLARYKELSDLDYSAASLNVGIATRRVGLDWRAVYQASAVYDASFGEKKLSQQRLQVSVGKGVTWRGFQLSGQIHAERIEADPEDYNNTAYGAKITVERALPFMKNLSIYTQVQVDKRDYDGFFVDLVGSSRSDDKTAASIGISWSPRRNLSIGLGYDWQKNRSTSDVNRYTAGSGSLGLSGRMRF